MSELIIKGDGTFSSIPITDLGDTPDYSQLHGIPLTTDWSGTIATPVTIWQSGQAYIQSYHFVDTQGYHHYNLYAYPLPNWNYAGTPPFVWGVSYTDNVDTVYLAACVTGNTGKVMLSINDSYPTDNYLFNGTRDDLIGQAQEDVEWDESPTDDPSGNLDNLNPIGGEFADRDSFSLTENISEWEMMDVPAEMSYGKLISAIVLHEDATHGYNLTQLNNSLFLADFWTNLKHKFEGLSDPLSMIISTIELPFTPVTSGTKSMKLGGVDVLDTNGHVIAVGTLGSRYELRNVGSISLKEVWGTSKDYSDTSISIYLPYVGCREIDTDLAVNYTLTLYARIDRWTGDILYQLYASNAGSTYKYVSSEFVAYRWSGNCAKQVPLGKVDNTAAILSLLGLPTSAVAGTAAGGAIGGLLAGGVGLLNADFSPIVQSSGSVSGSVGRMDLQFAYLVVKRGIPSYPNNWRDEIGAPRYQTFALSALQGTGYTLFSHIQLGSMGNATEEEKAELERILTTEGVIL